MSNLLAYRSVGDYMFLSQAHQLLFGHLGNDISVLIFMRQFGVLILYPLTISDFFSAKPALLAIKTTLSFRNE
jgi:hypothetical protein